MSKITGMLIFCVGAAVGAAGAWMFAKRRFEMLAREEIDSVKEVYKARAGAADISEDDEKPADVSEEKREDLMDYYKTVKENGYDGKKAADISERSPSAAYTISPDSFGELDYEQISLNYWGDGYLTDENDEIIHNPADILGDKALDSFGEYEDDSVYVRNDELRVDYEVLLDRRNFKDYFEKAYPGKTLG